MPENLTVSMQKNMDTIMPLLIEHGLSLMGAVLILMVGLWLSAVPTVWDRSCAGQSPCS